MSRASLWAAAVTALGLCIREHIRRKYAPRASLLLRSAAAARRIARATALLAFRRIAIVSLQALQLQLDLLVALRQLRAHEVERPQCLLEREQVLSAPIALQALGDLIGAGAHTHVLHRAQHLAIAFTGHDGPQELLARLAHHAGQDVGELDVHLRERLLHVLHMAALAAQQHRALAPQGAQHAHLLGRAKRPAQQAVKLGNSRTGWSSRSGGTATKWDALPMPMPAALG